MTHRLFENTLSAIIGECDQFLQEPIQFNNIATAIDRIEGVVEVIHNFQDSRSDPRTRIISLLDNALHLLSLILLEFEGSEYSQGRGRPKICISIERIEYLLSLNFHVPKIAFGHKHEIDTASSDNRAFTNLKAFLDGVASYGIPYRKRSDKGKENVLIAEFMIKHRGTNRASHICGRFVHNQRIERYWRDVTYGCIGFYKNVFLTMEQNRILNVDNIVHLYLLHIIFLPGINRHLHELMNAWNYHPLFTENNKNPRQLMLMHLPPTRMEINLTEEDLREIDFVCNEQLDLGQFENDYNDITGPAPIEPQINYTLRNHIDSLDPLINSNKYGVDVFINALRFI